MRKFIQLYRHLPSRIAFSRVHRRSVGGWLSFFRSFALLGGPPFPILNSRMGGDFGPVFGPDVWSRARFFVAPCF